MEPLSLSRSLALTMDSDTATTTTTTTRVNAPAQVGLKRKLTGHPNRPCPADLVPLIFRRNGFDIVQNPSLVKVSFLIPSPEMIAAYKVETLRAARSGDVDELRKLYSEGYLLQCCNAFGESLIHLACRRGSLSMVKFLVEEADVSLLVKDDYGRTPLHDALWTPLPNVDLVHFILVRQPELLCVKDVRGHTPLNYARKDHWETWYLFLRQYKDLLKPKGAKTNVSAVSHFSGSKAPNEESPRKRSRREDSSPVVHGEASRTVG